MKEVDLKIEILPTGYIRIKRGNVEYNKELSEIVSAITGDDEDTMAELKEFFKGSENIKQIVGDTILCG